MDMLLQELHDLISVIIIHSIETDYFHIYNYYNFIPDDAGYNFFILDTICIVKVSASLTIINPHINIIKMYYKLKEIIVIEVMQ